MRNNYPGNCETCRTRVAASAGEATKLNGRWVVFCAAHAGAGVTPAVTAAQAVLALVIRLTLAAGRVLCVPVSRLNGSFETYLAATRGAGAAYSKADNGQICDVSKAPALIAALQSAGFTCDVSPELVASMQARQAQAVSEVTDAQGRAAQIDAVLRERGLALFPFQARGIEWLAPRSTALLADDMGLGKTVQALCAAPVGAGVLVICPAVAKGVWVREAKRFRPDLTPVALSGRGSFRWPVAGEMVVVNYDILPGTPAAQKGYPAVLPVELATAPAGTVVIADEAHALKSSGAQRTSRFRALAQAAKASGGRVWLLTATPLLNRAPELWAIAQAMGVGRETFGGYDAYKRMWRATDGKYGTEWGQPTAQVATSLQAIMLRRVKSEVLTDLPAKTVRAIEVNGLSVSTKKLCDNALAALDALGVDLAKALALATSTADKSLAFEQLSAARAALATAKLDAAIEMIEAYEDAGEPVVVFSAHRAPIDVLGARDGWATITGDTAAEARTEIENAFQAGKLKGVACTIKAGGVAITLTKACNAVFVDEEWTPALNSQAQDRIYRIGQSRGVVITRLVAAHALDRRVAELLAEKAELIDSTVDAARVGATEVVVSAVATIDTAALAADTAKVAAAQATLAAATAPLAAMLVDNDKAEADPANDVEIAVTEECPF
jgi:SNF2 family DNA or RNA helicase